MSMTEEPVRVGVVGLGTRGMAHARYARESGHEVIGGVDPDVDARERFVGAFDAPAYESFEELYDERPDAVEIATPNAFHEAAAVAAFDRGFDVLIEKPLAHTLDSARRIVAAARKSDGFGMVGYNDRWRTVSAVLKARIDAGALGEIRHIEANKVRRRGLPPTGSWFMREELAGGGTLVDIGGHSLDVALWFMDFPDIETAFGTTRADFGDLEDSADTDAYGGSSGHFDVEDSATAMLRCAGGGSVVLDVAWAMNRDPKHEIVVCGTEAGARIDGHTLTIYETDAEGADYPDTDIEKKNDVWEAIEVAFLDAVAVGEPPRTNTVEEALEVQRAIDAIYRSAEQGKSVRP